MTSNSEINNQPLVPTVQSLPIACPREIKYHAVIMDDSINQSIRTLCNHFLQNNNDVFVTMNGLIVYKPVLEDNCEFVDSKTGKRMQIQNGQIKFIDKLVCYFYDENMSPYDASNVMPKFFKENSDIDGVMTKNGWLHVQNKPPPPPQMNAQGHYVGYSGFSGTSDRMWNGFEFIDSRTGEIMGFLNGEVKLKVEN